MKAAFDLFADAAQILTSVQAGEHAPIKNTTIRLRNDLDRKLNRVPPVTLPDRTTGEDPVQNLLIPEKCVGLDELGRWQTLRVGSMASPSAWLRRDSIWAAHGSSA